VTSVDVEKISKQHSSKITDRLNLWEQWTI